MQSSLLNIKLELFRSKYTTFFLHSLQYCSLGRLYYLPACISKYLLVRLLVVD
jgi:hypothetical protein